MGIPVTPGSIIGGKYQLERPLSRGGMGTVWVARHIALGTPVALKLMDATYAGAPAFLARFEREARIAAHLQSPHVVQVRDYGIDGGAPYLVMELLEGEDLGARLHRLGRLPLPEALRIATQAGKAVRRAHEAGLVHRDLKPGNLYLARVEDDEIVKVLDFGIVKETGGQLTGEVTRTGEVLGSPHYMSPEQVRGERGVDHRSDLWSLGVILFRALTGALPFPGDQLGPVLSRILVDPLPRAADLAPDLPPALDDFFARALARDPAQRFQSIDAMLDALRLIAEGPPRATAVAKTHLAPLSTPPLAPATLASARASTTGAAPALAGPGRSSRLAAMIALAGLLALLGASVAFASLWRTPARSVAEPAATPAPPQQAAPSPPSPAPEPTPIPPAPSALQPAPPPTVAPAPSPPSRPASSRRPAAPASATESPRPPKHFDPSEIQ